MAILFGGSSIMLRFIAFLAALLAAAPALAQSQAERTAIDFAIERGRLLYAVDRAAWVATDDLQAKMSNWRSAGLRGYVVDRDGDGFQVLFYGGPADSPVAFYRARVANHRVVSSEVFPAEARVPLTPLQRRLVAAREAAGAAAAASRRRPCGSRPFNVAVIPPDSADAPVDVYLMTPQERNGEYPFGGHYRVTIAADGSASGERAFTNSCLTMSGQAPGGSRGAVMAVSHLLDPVPTEIHVFTSLTSRMGVMVIIPEPQRFYGVSGDRIEAIATPAKDGRRRRR